ncbi:Maf family nucleotide pyrophosphatase [Candidatus Bipolaricaulota bacterium]|nr:Maf family nucleotide pyrophosphatase [Candidatus Bipolaricaulota bacterium]
MNIVLASSSKFRRQALDLLEIDYEVIPSEIDEKSIRDNDPKMLARKLAEAKSKDVGKRLKGDNLVIAGDLFILFRGTIYEKPGTEEEAIEMLNAFSGNQLEIISGVSVFDTGSNDLESALGHTEIVFRNISKKEIERYVSDYPVLELAGAFEKEGVLKFSEEVHGDLSFLTGLPLNKLIQLLQNNGFRFLE